MNTEHETTVEVETKKEEIRLSLLAKMMMYGRQIVMTIAVIIGILGLAVLTVGALSNTKGNHVVVPATSKTDQGFFDRVSVATDGRKVTEYERDYFGNTQVILHSRGKEYVPVGDHWKRVK